MPNNPKYAAAYYEANKEKILKQNAERRVANREKIRAESKAYYAANKAKIQAKRKTEEAKKIRSLQTKKRRAEAPHVFRASWLRNKYGLTQEAWDILFTSQGNRCAICKSDKPGSARGWHTDHCHETNNVRGILCRSCNTGLGKFKDDHKLLEYAIDYLRKCSKLE